MNSKFKFNECAYFLNFNQHFTDNISMIQILIFNFSDLYFNYYSESLK